MGLFAESVGQYKSTWYEIARDLPPLGETLPLGKMQVLATIPGISWSRDDVSREYRKLAERIGYPEYLLTDGAVELRENADYVQHRIPCIRIPVLWQRK